mmetsp:Transcript_16709/g.19247  ORF Transcript_16709/g.19247 Transcript_16709/m.19247 type:complete len:81 (-) Transcript_16709:171-413(-)
MEFQDGMYGMRIICVDGKERKGPFEHSLMCIDHVCDIDLYLNPIPVVKVHSHVSCEIFFIVVLPFVEGVIDEDCNLIGWY